ncbi:uncharacterized protein IWZ02DRAFT_517236, partial [Phyllosticta citriasiana]|uniref:uncharacterized protein n=1 Tax=Phyllosticta citriasiana TaxID=595635 RepID=UPI0030FD23CA
RKPHARNTSSLLRSLFPQLRQRARQQLFSIRHETLPSLRHSAQASIWRYIVRRQQLAAKRNSTRTTKLDPSSSRILALLRNTYARVLAGAPPKKHAHPRPTKPANKDKSMSALGAGRFYTANSYDDDNGSEGGLRPDGSREPGARRKKLAGYLKAANELRQAYQQTYTNGWRSGGDRGDWVESDDTPGAFPDATIVRSGDEEMVLFPSYARTHVKRKQRAPPPADACGNDAEYWRQEFERHEDDNAIVDVDVRGWIYYPHKGQMNRKHRLFVGVARQLVGLPAAPGKSSKPNSRSPSPHASERVSLQDRNDKREEEFVENEALNILKKGEKEASIAGRGNYSENPSRSSDVDSLYSIRSREPSPNRRRSNDTMDEEPIVTALQKRDSWKEPQKMNAAELAMANSHLMSRLKPFLAMPLANTPISIFFYNDKISRQRTIYTDAAGHFTTRAALNFVPTHIRIMVSENLSTTAEVLVTEPRGISLISDIDDTIKHSAISAGAREIFRNAFIRELGDLTIEGVREWYGALYEKGVKFHYVSNSPWQIYPVISQFFKMAGLPPGSFHLKQYSGMLQGIFEPVAERKKATLERLARDFPQRSFILVGDSGEADLEVYTDFVLDNPGRVLAVFIRDVTTKPQKGFFDPSVSPLGGSGSKTPKRRPRMSRRSTRSSAASEDDPELRAAIAASLRDLEESQCRDKPTMWSPGHSPGSSVGDRADTRPPLPRRPTDPTAVEAHGMESPIGNLIEFSDDEDTISSSGRTTPLSKTPTDLETIAEAPLHRRNAVRGRTTPTIGHRFAPPVPPKKPLKLRSTSQDSSLNSERRPSTASSVGKSPPPIRRPSTSVKTTNLPKSRSPLAQSPQVPESPDEKTQKTPPAPPPRRTCTGDVCNNTSSMAMAANKVSQAYNSLPQASAIWEGSGQNPSEARSASTSSTLPGNPDGVKKAPPPPPRRTTSPSPADIGKEGISRTPTFPTSAPNNARFHNANGSAGQRPATANASSSSLNLKPPQSTSSFPTSAPGSATPVNGGGSGNKREELWRKRWAKAEQTLSDNGVLLRSWRVGADVMDESMQLVEEALRKQQLLERSDSKGNALKLNRARAFRED